jgi:hypothetical protein
MTPEADPLVGGWRRDHDFSARLGIGAHVTVWNPFLAPDEWDGEEIRGLLRQFLPLEITLDRLEDREGALVILAEPYLGLRKITDAVTARWPALPPDNRDVLGPAYHMTIVRTPDPAIRAEAAAALGPRLPFSVSVRGVMAADLDPSGALRALSVIDVV